MRYAELRLNVVRYIGDAPSLPQMSGRITAVAITGDDPAIGDVWDGTDFSTPPAVPVVDHKLIDMGRLAELLPDIVILELEDFKSNTSATTSKRKAAARILLIIASGRQWDVYGNDYTALMTKLASNTALTGAQATAITSTLKG
jgi:hypothetical protein